MNCVDPWFHDGACHGDCIHSPYVRLDNDKWSTRYSEDGPGEARHASTQGLDPTPRGEREKGPDMQNTQHTPPDTPPREKWRLIGRRPIKGHTGLGEFYLWERDEPGALYPMRYGVPVQQFWVS